MTASIVIPCHNAEAYLPQTIGAALDQTRPPDEIVVVDDGSTDGSLDIALRFEQRFPDRVRVLSESSGSAGRSRNLGAAAATGDAIMFLDADDVIAPDTVEALVAALDRAGGGIAICPWYRLERMGGRWERRPASCRARAAGEDPLAAWLTGWYHPPCSVMWSREAFERAGRWDENLRSNQDGDIVMRALALGCSLVATDRGAGFYRRLPEGEPSLSALRFKREGIEARLRVVRKIAALLESDDRIDRYRPALHEALVTIADLARVAHPDLADLAESEAHRQRRGRPDPAHRVAEVLRRGRRLPGAARRRIARARGVDGEAASTEEVRFGLERAAEVIGVDSAADDPLPTTDRHRPSRPAVSVIIPTYNRAATLRHAIDSVLGQTFGDLELLVVDDGSTDETPTVVGAIDDPRLHYLRADDNAGVAAARNRGLRAARGDLIAFLDSDDVWLPDKLGAQVRRLAQRSDDVGLVYGGVQTDDGRGNRTIDLPFHRGDIYRDMLERNVLHGAPSNGVIRRDVVATVGFFDEDLPAIEDYDYWLRACRFFSVDFVEQPGVRYNDPQGAERRSLDSAANLEARELLYRKHRRELRRHGRAVAFLHESVRRHLAAGDIRGSRRPALRAVRLAPLSPAAHLMLVRTLVARPLRRLRRRARHSAGRADPSVRLMLYTATSRRDWGGVQSAYARLAEGLRRRGHEVRDCWAESAPHDPDDDDVYPLEVFAIDGLAPTPRSLWAMCRSSLRLAAGLRRYRPEVVNVHFVNYEFVHFLLLKPFFRYKLVASTHGSDVMRPGGWRDANLLPRLVARADAITAVAPATAERIRRYPGVTPDQVRVIPNGVDFDFWSGALPEHDGHRAPTIVTVGRLVEVKGHATLLEAFSRVRSRVPDARLVIVGEGEEHDHLVALGGRLGIEDSVDFVGELPREQIREHMARARVFTLPSRREGMPLALLEAMSAGLPTVATAVGGIPGIVGPETGILVPPDDPAPLADALANLLADPHLAARMGCAGRVRAASFDATSVDESYERLFREVLAGV